MNVFAVIATKQESIAPIKAAVEAQFANNFIQAGDALWFVSGPSTTLETYQKLGVSGGVDHPLTDIVVLAVGVYWGNTYGTTWEWIKNRMEAKANG